VIGRLERHYHQKQPASRHSHGLASASGLSRRGFGFAAGLAFAAMAASVAGCAVSVPIASLSGANDDATGAIPSSALERLLEPEDWRRAKAALSTALDPQGNGSLVRWDNPQSGASGSFAPTGKAYPAEAQICRGFKTDVARKAGAKAMQGVACAGKDGEWTIAQITPSQS
jgi:surface antigen